MTVWEYARRQLAIKQCLYGHTDAVTCLSSSPAYNVIVSGSRDGTAIIWDLSRCLFVRQLRGHAGPVAAVAINELTVFILSIMYNKYKSMLMKHFIEKCLYYRET